MKGVQLEFPEPGLLVPGPLSMQGRFKLQQAELAAAASFSDALQVVSLSCETSSTAAPKRAVSSRIQMLRFLSPNPDPGRRIFKR